MANASRVSAATLSVTQWLILALVLAADVLDLMDSTIGNIAAPAIVADLGGGEGLIRWLGAGYALAMGALLVLGGRLGDRFGKRRMFLVGLAGFTLASVACGLSINPFMLVFSRVVQGAFGALLLPQGLSLLLASLSREQLPTAFSAFGPTMGLSAVLGPIAAGFIISANLGGWGWRPVFLINLVLGGAAFFTALRWLPHDEPGEQRPLDVPGTLLLGLSLLLLFFGLIEGPLQSLGAMTVAAGVLGLVAFAVWQVKARNPLIKMSLFQNRGFTAGLLLGLGYFASVNGFSYVVGLFFQMVLKLSPAEASLAMAPLLVGIIVASFVGRPLIGLWGRKLVLGGLLVTLTGALALAFTVLVAVDPLAFAPALFVIGCGMGTCFGSIFDVALGKVAPEESGSASGTLSAVQQLANAVGSAVVTGVYFERMATHGGSSALQTTVLVMAVLVAVCLALVPLLPRRAQEEGHA